MSDPVPLRDIKRQFDELIEKLAEEKDTNVRAMLTRQLWALITPEKYQR